MTRHQLAAGRLHQAAHRRRADLHHVARRERQAHVRAPRRSDGRGHAQVQDVGRVRQGLPGARLVAGEGHRAAQLGHVPPLPDRRDARTRPRVGPPRLHGRQGHRRLEAGLVHPDDEAGDLVHRHGIAPSRPSRVEASHLHRAASRPEGRRPHQGVPADRHHRPSHPGVLPLRASSAALVPRAVARAARGDQPEDGRRVRHRAGRLGVDRNRMGQDPQSGRPVLRREGRRHQPRAHVVVPRGEGRRPRLAVLPGEPADRPLRPGSALRHIQPARLPGEDLQGNA